MRLLKSGSVNEEDVSVQRFELRSKVHRSFQAAVCLARDLSPSGVFRVIPPGEEATALASLPIAVLDPTEIQAETFALWGIHTLGMLAHLPEKRTDCADGSGRQASSPISAGRAPAFIPTSGASVRARREDGARYCRRASGVALFGVGPPQVWSNWQENSGLPNLMKRARSNDGDHLQMYRCKQFTHNSSS
jgi:hypothetical protein